MNLVLIGYRGCGKTRVGMELTRILKWPMVDTDALLQERAGGTIRDIIAARGETGFRELEVQVVAELAHLDRHIISTGGGVVLRDDNIAVLKKVGKLVWLTAAPEVLWQRIKGDAARVNTRPEVDWTAELQRIRDALEQRGPLYARAADLTVAAQAQSVEQIAQTILRHFHLGGTP